MDRADALIWLAKKTAASSEPKLDEADLNRLLDSAAGRQGATSFTRRQLYMAAAEGWEEKTSASAEYHSEGEQRVHEHAAEQYRHYSRLAATAGGAGAVARAADTDAMKALL